VGQLVLASNEKLEKALPFIANKQNHARVVKIAEDMINTDYSGT
jgi:hypothetical protein